MKHEARVRALEARLGARPEGKSLRVVVVHDNDTVTQAEPGERLFVVRVISTKKQGGPADVEFIMPRPGPTNGDGDDAELEAEVQALERERDKLRARRK